MSIAKAVFSIGGTLAKVVSVALIPNALKMLLPIAGTSIARIEPIPVNMAICSTDTKSLSLIFNIRATAKAGSACSFWFISNSVSTLATVNPITTSGNICPSASVSKFMAVRHLRMS